MRVVMLAALFVLVQTLQAQPNVSQRVFEDAIVLDRVAQASNRDLPRDLLTRIILEDIDLMRGKRADGTYQYATFERFDSGRVTQSFSIDARPEDKMESVEIAGDWVYRVILEVPSRKLLVRKNRPVWVERLDLDYVDERSAQSVRESIDVKQWLQPGEFRPVDLPSVARRATVKVAARAEEKGGYGNLTVALVKARIVDNTDSPYANALASAKTVQRALESNDVAAVRTGAQRMRASAGPVPAGSSVDVVTRRSEAAPAPAPPAAASPELRNELQSIEDLLTGTEQERREGMDRLHQMIRRMRQ